MAQAIPYFMMAGAAMSAVSSIRQGKAAQAAANFNASMAEQNAEIAHQEAQEFARLKDREIYMRLGAIRAAQGASGGAAAEGSVLDVLGDVASEGERERQNILYSGELKARGYQTTATLDRMQGAQARQASYMSAGSELLSGMGSALYTRDRLKRT